MSVAGPKKRWSNLGARLGTGLIIALVVIAPFYVGGWIWVVLVGLFGARVLYEWMRMTDPDASGLAFAIAGGGLLIALLYAGQTMPIWAIATLVVTTLFAVAERMRRGGPGWTAIGLPYIIVPAIVLVMLRGSEVGFDTRGFTQLIFVILIVIAADVGAYFGGSMMGGPKLAPRLSPNKTWSGFVSGLVFAMVVAAVCGLFIGLPVLFSALLAIPIVILSVLGDLGESAVKRRLDIKDTGTILPGHGGLLDRVDSLMAAVVGAAFIFIIVGDRWPIA
ncbi:MAG: phosphatidate cytidylyltransferase [Litorimonas sp.]